jgi:alpha-L-glutamate ligase-like protein
MKSVRLRRFWAWPGELRKQGIVGINCRNLDYLFEVNPRSSYRTVDDKILTKTICREQGIPVPETYAIVRRFGDVAGLAAMIGQREEFVVKPAGGSGGRGVLVIVGRNDGSFRTATGTAISLAELQYHVSTILSGLYSLAGQCDRAIVEQRIVPHPVFEKFSVEGTPDIRLIMYRGLPVIAMLRLPTDMSKGRANLHQGAVAAGIDLGTGETFGGVYLDRAVSIHPNTGAPIGGLQIPDWPRMVEIATSLSKAIRMGYIGIDIMLDVDQGPIVLEVNARPGLSVQIANRAGLLPMLEAIEVKSCADLPAECPILADG